MTAGGTYRPGARVTTEAERVAEIVTGHQDHGTTGDWDDPAGKLRNCSCGWSRTYPGRTDHGRGLWVDHIVALLLDAARPDAPQPAVTDDAVERAEVPTWDDATVERAVQAACAEAGWDWTPEPGVPSPAESMRPIVVAALSIAMPHPAESQWRSATFYGKPDGGLVLSPREAAARARRADMEIALDAIITAHPAVKHEDSQEADENYGDLLNELVDAALAAAGVVR